MNSTPTPEATEPHNPLIVSADEQIARAYEKIGKADEQLARVTEQLAKMGLDAARPPSALSDPQPPPERPARRALVGLPLLACIVVAALFWQSSYSGGAKLIVARWTPQFVSSSSLRPEEPSPVQRVPSTVQMAAAEAATPLAQTSPQDATPTATATLPDHTQLPQTIARDLANVQRDIEQLKTNQQQMASDNSKAIEQLKASQEEMKRQLAMISEQNLSKTSPPPTQPKIASDNSGAIEQLKTSQEEMKRQLAMISKQNLSKTSSTPMLPTTTSRKPKRQLYSPYERALPRYPSDWDYEEW
jgi:hypothetical protein